MHCKKHQQVLPAGVSFFLLRAAPLARAGALLTITAMAVLSQAAPAPPDPPCLQFAAAVSVDYARGLPLRGWDSACRVIQATLSAWQTGTVVQAVVRNPSPLELQQFLHGLPGPEAGAVQIVYLAARHTPAGAWQFTRTADGTAAWDALLRDPPPAHPGRLVLLDVCHAGAVVETAAWTERMRPAATLLASARGEWTSELDFSNRQPFNLAARYPAAHAWLRQNLAPGWDGRLSNLGLAWLLAFQQTPQAPQTLRDWQVFFGRCESEARRLRELLGPRRSSSISQRP